MEYLRNSKEISAQLRKLFTGRGRKVAIVGFVGKNALEHLPVSVSDLEVICWPKAGATHPEGIQQLLDNNVMVSFCDNLHQKIYWREKVGLIVGSANLSNNGLGDGGLHEFGVYCADMQFDIDDILKKLKCSDVTNEALEKLYAAHRAHVRKNGGAEKHAKVPSTSTFDDKSSRAWKLVTWSVERKNNDAIQSAVETEFGRANWSNDNDIDPKANGFKEGEFVLQIKVNDKGRVDKRTIKWLLVDRIIRKASTHAIVQIDCLDERTPVPFEINKTFKNLVKIAFDKAVVEDGINELDRKDGDAKPLRQVLMSLYQNK